MPAIPVNNNAWSEFSRAHLAHIQENESVPAKHLSKAMNAHLQATHEQKLSREATSSIKKYAFQKAGQKKHQDVVLTHEAAKEVFHHYHSVVSSVQAELNAENDIERPAKPTIPKGLARLSIFSTSVVEKYLDPRYKANSQKMLHQVQKINQAVKPVFEKDPQLDPDKILALELVAKQLAYFNPQNGEKFQIPIDGRIVEYQSEEIHLWMGMYAYGFKPVDPNEKAPPILAFSGTRLAMSSRGSLATVTADFDPRGVGYIAYNSGKKEITKWLEKVNGNALVTGHSLGGAISHYATIDNPNLVQGAYTFSAPGISAKYGRKWKKMEKDPFNPTVIYNFNHSEDKVPTFGQSSIGTNFQVICAVEKTTNKKMADQRNIHKKRLFGRKVALLCKTHPQKSLSVWKQRAISVIPFVVCLALLCIGRALFGIQTSKPYVSVFGPLRWSWRKLVTEKFAAKYFEHGAAAA